MNSLPRRLWAATVAAILGVLGAFVGLMLGYLPNAAIPWLDLGIGYALTVLFLTLIAAGLLGGLSSRIGAFLIGLFLAALSAFAGAALALVFVDRGGESFFLTAIISEPVFWYLVLPYLLGAALVWCTAGRVYAKVVLRPPQFSTEPRTIPPVAVVPTHADSPDGVVARRALLREYGWLTVDAASDADLDAAIVRLGSEALVRHESPALHSTGLTLTRIGAHARVAARDVVVVGNLVLVSPSSETDSEGVAELRSWAGDRGFTVRAVRMHGGAHLGEVSLALPDGSVLVRAAMIAETAVIPAARVRHEVCAPFGFVLDSRTVAVPESAEHTVREMRALGFHVELLPGDSGIRLVG